MRDFKKFFQIPKYLKVYSYIKTYLCNQYDSKLFIMIVENRNQL